MADTDQKRQQPIIRHAPAKLNLFLHVVGRRADGYHELESVFAFTEKGDILTVREAEDISLRINGPFSGDLQNVGGEGEDNLVIKAARVLRREAGIAAGADILLSKNLPIASGIGGGSSDAAATLLALRELWHLNITDEHLQKIALSLGADVPACLFGKPLHVSGIGEQIQPTKLSKAYSVLLVNPGEAVSTPAVFAEYHNVRKTYRDRLNVWGSSVNESYVEWLNVNSYNDLEKPARNLTTSIDLVLRSLQEIPQTKLVRMSGSGATCFALFDSADDAERAHQTIRAERPEWWIWQDRLITG